MKTFKERFLAGQATKEQIDDDIEAWHNGKSTKSLASYLGFTSREYAMWLERPRIFWDNLENEKAAKKR